MLARFGLLVAILAVLELAAFDWRYKDLVYLSRPASALEHASTGDFRTFADRALARPTLTRATLEVIAQTATARHDDMVMFPALRRLAREYPDDGSVNLRLAEALRGVGHIEEAEPYYRRAPEGAPALVGLARNERAAGRSARAVELFRKADALKPFDVATLDEFFWTAALVSPRDAEPIGTRLLAIDPTMDRVRDKLIECARIAHDERRVLELAEQGVQLEPTTALWHRRIGESRLRQGQPREAATAFARAAAAPDGVRADAAQTALSLEVAGEMQQALNAWRRVEPGVWQSNAEWIASRARTIAAVGSRQSAVGSRLMSP